MKKDERHNDRCPHCNKKMTLIDAGRVACLNEDCPYQTKYRAYYVEGCE